MKTFGAQKDWSALPQLLPISDIDQKCHRRRFN